MMEEDNGMTASDDASSPAAAGKRRDVVVEYETAAILAVIDAADRLCTAAELVEHNNLTEPLDNLHEALTDLESVYGMGLGPLHSAREIIRSRHQPAAAAEAPQAEGVKSK